MGFTLKSSYALRALYKMAKSTREGKEKLSLVEIVQGNEIPRDFLEKIFGKYVWFRLYNAMMRELGSMTLEDLLIYGDKISEIPPESYKIPENPR
ncbi:MAG: Transcriptional regulator, BadM/Rrf2 family [Mesotoga infera]|uniref:Transcriptional regulator, BadM/Rrf2 family n=1 Tax=Mesotoga infera TaxID=1236046 RepID=A0A101HXW4_9BACT|nr:MAG: Transcriptional regulator, BadM/Rrf2 family [Mesotoga infera]